MKAFVCVVKKYEIPRIIELKPVGKCCTPELSFVFPHLKHIGGFE